MLDRFLRNGYLKIQSTKVCCTSVDEFGDSMWEVLADIIGKGDQYLECTAYLFFVPAFCSIVNAKLIVIQLALKPGDK